MRLLVDMNLSPDWCEVLRRAGWDSVHWGAVGAPDAADRDLMAWALREGYVVLTHDLDLAAILASTGSRGPSVIQVRAQDVTPSALAALVVRVLERHGEALESGAVISVDEERARLRILPISRR
jgi:predicted nuclease of predicted toxin-antitoxin system